jgi:hypothetical protein
MALALCLPACQDEPSAHLSPATAMPTVAAEIVQLRRDPWKQFDAHVPEDSHPVSDA